MSRKLRKHFELFLPDLVQTLVVVGEDLLYPVDKLHLEHCFQLTEVVLLATSDCARQPVRLLLPSSLEYLQVQAQTGDDWTKVFDWRCLETCTNLEALTLPDVDDWYLSEHASAVQLLCKGCQALACS